MVIIPILELLFQTIWIVLKTIISTTIEMLPELLEIKKTLNALSPTPAQMIAWYLGVPAFVATSIIKFIKKKLAI